MVDAFTRAYEGDPLSAFGGILGFNRTVDEATAQQITEPNRFIECIVAPAYAPEALHLLTTRPSWKKNVRILQVGTLERTKDTRLDYRRVDGGLLVQSRDVEADDFIRAKIVTQRQPTPDEMRRLTLCLAGRQARQKQRHRARQGSDWYWGRAPAK